MPAQKRITRDAIVKAAYDILRKSGIKAVNARSIAKRLGCSTQPIYHAFKGMDELKEALVSTAEERHNAEVHRYMDKSEYAPYIAYGMGFVFLAKEEKELFRFLFLTSIGATGKPHLPANLPHVLDVMQRDYGYDPETAQALHENMSLYAYGLALGMSTGIIDMTEAEIASRLETEFTALTSIYGHPACSPDIKQAT